MDINGHIKILLFRHNCIVIPGFGGIVMQYAPATIHPTQHIFQPPRKAFAFNKALTTNDGLLISHVANAEEMTYDEAEMEVRNYVHTIESSLNQKGDFFIHDVGKFVKDIEGNILFRSDETVNFLLNSFGLDHFISPAIVRRDAYEPQIQTNTIVPKKKKRFGWFGLLSLAIVAVYLIVETLSVNNVLQLPGGPTAGISFDSFTHTISKEALKNNGESQPVITTHHKDTLVQIIVIRDETKQAAGSTAVKDSEKIVASPTSTTGKESAGAINNSTTTNAAPVSNYNAATLGNYVLIFYSTPDSLKATEVQTQLITKNIGVNLIHPTPRKFEVCKTGYLTAVAVVKDLSVYKLMGYPNVSIESIDNK